ncbi:MAG: alpha/beta hydrolase, partial [Ilumatobacteraceae bacterium]
MTRRADTPAPPSPDQLRRWGLDPAWSRHVHVPAAAGTTHRWHLLDTAHAAPPPAGTGPTVVCVHGNPTWSWMWGSFLHRFAGAGYRVVAPDLLGMGYSDRTVAPRRYAERVEDLDRVLDVLGIDGPVVLVAHDWGGAIAMGWAVEHPDRVAAMILANTGIAVPAGRRAPGVIRFAATRGVHDLTTRRTRLFVHGTGWLSRDRLTAIDREALAAPYRRAVHRTAIADFVADIPFTADHPSAAPIDVVASSLGTIAAPTLLLWGGRDPVFDDDMAADLLARFRRGGGPADLHRFPGAGHLVVAETAPGPGARGAAGG